MAESGDGYESFSFIRRLKHFSIFKNSSRILEYQRLPTIASQAHKESAGDHFHLSLLQG